MSAQVVPDYLVLAELLSSKRQGRSVAMTNGCFDILHVGHVRLLQAAAEEGDLLVVALNTDESVRGNKGPSRPLVPLEERMEMIAALAGVDFVTSFSEATPNQLTVPERTVVEAYGGRIAICGDEKTHSSTELARRMAEDQ